MDFYCTECGDRLIAHERCYCGLVANRFRIENRYKAVKLDKDGSEKLRYRLSRKLTRQILAEREQQ